jgi:nucleotide-binding universal stress UspA family protein
MYKKILVPLDGSELASAVLPHVQEVVRCTHASIILLRVTPEPSYIADGSSATMLANAQVMRRTEMPRSITEAIAQNRAFEAPGPNQSPWIEHEVEAAQTYIDALAADLVQSGMHVRSMVMPGAVAETILDVADAESVDLVAMSTHGRTGVSRFLLGSVADRVVHHATVPVLLVRSKDLGDQKPGEPVAYNKILVPLDGSELASAILPYAREMALCTGAGMMLLQAIPEPMMEMAESELMLALSGVAPAAGRHSPDESEAASASRSRRQLTMRAGSDLAKQIELETEAAQSNLNAAAAVVKTAGIRVETEVQVGRPAEIILDVAKSAGVDMIAMATHGRSGIRRFLMGSVADRVVRHAHVPVLLVRPEHF